MARPVIAWSFSSLNMFEQCRRKYWAVKIAKRVNDENQYNVQGDDEHQSLQHYAKGASGLPSTLIELKPLIDKINAAPGERYVEQKLCLTQQLVPCKWNDWDTVWVRGAGDYVKVNGPRAWYFDWKSGKKKSVDDTEDQAQLTSALIMAHHPGVQKVTSGIVFYRWNQMNPHVVHRADLGRIWNGYISRVRAMEQAKLTDDWPATPNPLCGWCPYMACPHNTVEARLKREREKNGG